MVSLNPEYGIEVSALNKIAENVKDDDPELYNILIILVASIIGNDQKKLLEYCNSYLSDKVYSENLKDQINKMLDEKFKEDDSDFFKHF